MKSPFSESPSQAVGASIRIGLTVDEIKQAFRDNLVCGMGRLEAVATKHDLYFALALTVRDRLFHRSVASIENYGGAGVARADNCQYSRTYEPEHGKGATRRGRDQKGTLYAIYGMCTVSSDS